MADPLDTNARSALMAKVRATGNKSTEQRVENALTACGIDGWIKHPKDVTGTPDFFFPRYKLAVFVDGCFWHGCSVCNRNIPSSRADFWKAKIESNVKRDNRQRRQLWRAGFHVMRIHEHSLRTNTWLVRLRSMLEKLER